MAGAKKRKTASSFESIVIEKLTSLDSKMDELRTEVVPKLNSKLEVLNTKVEERTGKKATIVSVIGALVAVAGAAATVVLKP
jgi:uncharacterized protein YktB (UPF0637 family)